MILDRCKQWLRHWLQSQIGSKIHHEQAVSLRPEQPEDEGRLRQHRPVDRGGIQECGVFAPQPDQILVHPIAGAVCLPFAEIELAAKEGVGRPRVVERPNRFRGHDAGKLMQELAPTGHHLRLQFGMVI